MAAKNALSVPNEALVMAGAEFLLSMVEARLARNGGGKMEPGEKTHQELEKIEEQIARLQAAAGPDEDTRRDIQQLRDRIEALRKDMSTSHYKAWDKTELARHPQRPYPLDYIERIFTDWSEIHGDRGYADDPAIICGMARFHGEEVMIVGHQKARDTKQKVYRNFGMPNPEGYRKAMRVMKIAEKFGRPLFTFVDTPGAYPGLGAEERGQAEAIAHNLREMARLQIPIIATITGEGGSGGALAIAIADRVLMMENSIYSVISPEGCASIMSDLDLGMNNWMADPFKYPEKPISRGKVLSKADLDRLGGFARYEDVDGDGVGYRTLPGTDHPAAAYFARGSGHNEKAQYSERPDDFERNMERLNRKFETARSFVPRPEVDTGKSKIGIIGYGTSHWGLLEARDQLRQEYNVETDYLRLRAYPFTREVHDFVKQHDRVYVVEQNRDAQMLTLLKMDLEAALHTRLRSIAHIHGLPLDARSVTDELMTMEGK